MNLTELKADYSREKNICVQIWCRGRTLDPWTCKVFQYACMRRSGCQSEACTDREREALFTVTDTCSLIMPCVAAEVLCHIQHPTFGPNRASFLRKSLQTKERNSQEFIVGVWPYGKLLIRSGHRMGWYTQDRFGKMWQQMILCDILQMDPEN